ncbi:hypothetical protein MXB_5142 [Myxobolus squamalis]|nr:hypothetical protein MXB_5142 [Myxobolus squamalis]
MYLTSKALIVHSGKNLSDDSTLKEIGANNLSIISLFSKILGGKVHGSLARAGKVKNQTKKVEKKEKRKPKTGRCKQRLKYNRRFNALAAAAPGARRKGPNSNSAKREQQQKV